ncbi:MAG TPA: hypothetical protein VG265_05545, partial [Gaiellaceae bacterium]|nr:hypothetical protein [Gaiellaceae bacterium]
IEGGRTVEAVAKIAVASAALAAVAYVVWEPLDSAFGRSFVAQAASLGAALAAAAATYLGLCRLFRVRELDALVAVTARLRRA